MKDEILAVSFLLLMGVTKLIYVLLLIVFFIPVLFIGSLLGVRKEETQELLYNNFKIQ